MVEINKSPRDLSKYVIVKSKVDGSLVALSRATDFNPRFHEKVEAVVAVAPVVTSEVTVEAEKESIMADLPVADGQ